MAPMSPRTIHEKRRPEERPPLSTPSGQGATPRFATDRDDFRRLPRIHPVTIRVDPVPAGKIPIRDVFHSFDVLFGESAGLVAG